MKKESLKKKRGMGHFYALLGRKRVTRTQESVRAPASAVEKNTSQP